MIISMKCPRCGASMVPGYLRIAAETAYVVSMQSLESSPLQVSICLGCGHIELQALCPENLTRQDITDQEICRSMPAERY